MRIGILNFQDTNWNYGALLQAAALQYEIEKLGHTTQHIDLRWREQPFLSQVKSDSKMFVKKLLGIKQPENHYSGCKKVFEQFRKKWIKRTRKFYTSESLQKAKFNYDMAVVGSDQVWRWSFIGNGWLETYFLGFLPENTKRISYAASFGFDYWEKEKDAEDTLKVKKLLQNFSAVSVREKAGIKICKNNFDISAEFVLDPVLLAGKEFFDKIIKNENLNNEKQDIIAYYFLSSKSGEDIVSFLEKELSVCKQNIFFEKTGNVQKYNSVENFLKQIKESKIVITDSFHGACLSIIFGKPFVAIAFQNGATSRFENILGMCGLNDCLIDDVYDEERLKKALSFAMQINWGNVNKNLENMRSISREFLITNLKVE